MSSRSLSAKQFQLTGDKILNNVHTTHCPLQPTALVYCCHIIKLPVDTTSLNTCKHEREELPTSDIGLLKTENQTGNWTRAIAVSLLTSTSDGLKVSKTSPSPSSPTPAAAAAAVARARLFQGAVARGGEEHDPGGRRGRNRAP